MNHIYKSIFNKALGVFTAVPEFASAHGKGSERTVVGRVAKGTAGFAASALAISVGLALTSTNAVAAPGIFINNGQDPACLAVIDDVATSALQLIYGGSKTIYPAVGVAAGSPLGTKTNFELDARNPCLPTGGTGAENHDTQTNRSLFYNSKNLTLGGRLDVNSGIIGVGDRGTDGAGATNSIRMGTGTTLDDANKKLDGIAIGKDAGVHTDYSISIGSEAESGKAGAFEGKKSIAIGYAAKSLGSSSIAIGARATNESTATEALDALAIGNYAKTDGMKTISIGSYNTASGVQSIVIANNFDRSKDPNNRSSLSTATATRAIVVGPESHATAEDALAIGNKNTVASARTYVMGNNINAAAGTDDSLAFGTRAHVSGANQVSIGKDAGADNTSPGEGNTAGISIGDSAGRYATAGKNNTSIGQRAGQYANGDNNVAIGKDAGSLDAAGAPLTTNTVSIGSSSKVKGQEAIAVGNEAEAISNSAIAIGNSAKGRALYSTAIGLRAKTSDDATMTFGESATAVGHAAAATRYSAAAFGHDSFADGESSVALGYAAKALGTEQIAIGAHAGQNRQGTQTGANFSVAIGRSAGGDAASALGNHSGVSVGLDAGRYLQDGSRNTAVGGYAGQYVKGSYNVALGHGAGSGTATEHLAASETISIGHNSKASAAYSTAIGSEAKAKGIDSIAMGLGATVEDAAGFDGIAIGTRAKAKEKGMAVGAYSQADGVESGVFANAVQGKGSTASGRRSSIIGVESTVSGNNSVAIGDTNTVASNRTYVMGNNINAAAGTPDSLAFGTRASVGGASSIALGSNTKTYTDDSISIGSFSESGGPATTGNLLGTKAIAIGYETKALATSAVALGYGATVENGHDSIAIGVKAKTSTQKSTTIGSYSEARGDQSTVIANNYDSKAGKAVSIASGARSQVYGAETTVSGNNSVAIGDTNTVAGARTYAIGNNINVAAGVDDALAFGTRAAVGAENTVAIGANANAAQANSVALGAGSATSDVHTGDYTLNTSYTAAGLPNAANGTVSVGSAGKERQIQNVAAGVISATSTDAINGSQLYATNNYLSNLAGDVKTKLGGNAALGNDGHLTMTDIGGTGKDNVHEAIAAVKGVADTAVQEVESENPTALSVKKDGTKVTLTPNFITGDLVNADGTVNAPATADEGKLVSAKTVADALKANHFVVDTKGNTETGSEADAKVGSGNKVTFEAGNNLVAKQANTANGGATVKFSLKDDISLNSVTAGTGANQVVLGNDGVKVGGNTYINNDGLNANSKVISNVADGVAPTDAVNKGQLDAVKNVADSAVQSVDVATNENNLVVDNNDPKNPKLRLRKAVDLDSIKLENNVGEKSFLNSAGLTIEGGPAVTRSGINANNTKVTNVTDGDVNSTSKEAVNGSQLYNVASNVADLVGPDAKIDPATGNVTVADPTKGIGETGKGTIGDAIKAVNKAATAAKTTVKEGDNITVTPTTNTDGSTTYTVATKKDLDVTSVTAGNTTVNTNGLTITGGPSVTRGGIDAGDRVISGVKAGDVSANSKEAVNGSQLYATNTKLDGVKAKADTAVQDVKSGDENALTAVKDPNTNIVTVTPKLSGDLVDADGNITAPTTPADKGKLVTAGTVAQALANTHFVVDTKATDGELDAASKHDQKIKAGNKVTLQAGKNLKAKQTNGANGAEVEFSLKDSISLKEVKVGEGSANEVVLNNNGVNVAGNTYINKDGLNANDKKITNVAPGAVTAASKDAVNGSQLYNVANNVKDLIGPDAAIDPATGKVTVADPAKGIGETGKGNIGDAIKHVNDAAKAAAETAAKHTTVVEGKNVKVTKGKNAAGGDEYTVATKDDLDVTSVTAGNTTVNTNGLTITGGPSVTRGGIDAGNRVISGVKAGDVSATSQEAVNGSQLHATNTKLDGVKAKADTAVQDVKSGDENALTAVKDPNTNIVTVTPKLSGDLVDANGNITAPTTPADKGKLVTAGTVADALANTHFVVDTKATDGELDAASQADQKIKAGNKVTLQAGKNLKAKQTNGANGAQVEFSLKDSISLKEVTAGEGANQVVLGNDGVKVGGNTYINNAGLNANGNKITNVADGVDPTDAVNKSQLDAVKGVADSAVKSVNVANGEQNLVVDNTDPKNPKLSLKKDLTVDSVKAGDSTLNNDGLTIAGGPSVKKDGINAGDKTITNVAPGAVTPTSKDAVNGGQLYNVANNVKDLIGPDAAIDPATGKVTVADPAKGIGETGKGNIGDAIKHVNDAAKAAADTAKKHTTVEQGDNIVVEESTNADGGKHYKVSTAKNLNVDSVKAGDTTVNNDGVTIAGGPSVTKGGINAGGNTITNVADGVNPNDAVNKGQLDAVKNVADSAVKSVDVANGEQNLVVDNSDPKNPKLSLKKDLTVDSVKAGDSTLNTDGLTIAGGPSVKKDGIDAGDKKITNVAAGDVAENSKDAVNGGQLYDVAKNVADLVGPDAKIDPATGKVTVTDPAKGIGETGKGNIGDAIKHVNDLAKNAADTAKKHTTVEQGDNIVVEESLNADGGKHYKVSTARDLNVDSVKAGDTTVNNDGVTINNGPSMTKDGINANNTKVTNVADGVDAADAVNKGQLDKVDTKVSNVAQNVVNVLGGDATVNGNGDITMSNIGETGKGNINDAIKSVNDLAKKAAAEKTSVKAKEGRSNVTVTEGINAAGGHEYTVDVERSVTNAGSDYVTVTNNHDADTNTTTYTVDVSAKTKASLAKADSAVQGLTSKDGNLNFTKGANGNVEVSFNDNLNVKNVTTDRVQVANGPSMSKDGINAAGKAISNVANGNVAADSKDAVNGGQLHETAKSVADVIGGGATVKDGKVVVGQNGIGNTGQNTVHGAIAAINQNTVNNFNQIRGDLRKMDRDLRGGIAGALATAGLPQAFRPGKSMVAAAASTYRGQSGLAIGVSRISDNGKIILKVTGNTNSRGDFGGTIGAGYQW